MGELSLATVLLLKAEQDERAFDILAAHPDTPDEVLGFHAQQAAEKMLKAALKLHGVDYPHTHNLGFLLGLLRRQGAGAPPHLHELRRLTPFAATLRYEVLSAEAESLLDAGHTRRLLHELRSWVETLLEPVDPEH